MTTSNAIALACLAEDANLRKNAISTCSESVRWCCLCFKFQKIFLKLMQWFCNFWLSVNKWLAGLVRRTFGRNYFYRVSLVEQSMHMQVSDTTRAQLTDEWTTAGVFCARTTHSKLFTQTPLQVRAQLTHVAVVNNPTIMTSNRLNELMVNECELYVYIIHTWRRRETWWKKNWKKKWWRLNEYD